MAKRPTSSQPSMRSTPTCNEVTCPTAWSSTPSGSGCWKAVEVSYLLYYHKVMAQREKRSVSLPPDLARAVEQAAKAEGTTFSAWLAQTAAHRLRLEAGRQAIAEWERENGPLTEAELADGLARARSSLGRAPADPAGSWEWPTSRLFRCRNTVNAEIRTVRGSPGPQRRGRERLTPCGLRPRGPRGLAASSSEPGRHPAAQITTGGTTSRPLNSRVTPARPYPRATSLHHRQGASDSATRWPARRAAR